MSASLGVRRSKTCSRMPVLLELCIHWFGEIKAHVKAKGSTKENKRLPTKILRLLAGLKPPTRSWAAFKNAYKYSRLCAQRRQSKKLPRVMVRPEKVFMLLEYLFRSHGLRCR
ncbi:unnamed protein product [Acanthoscelides obtectus]|uniref:Uncharacterized protein n=1 Tax=Acanthoscelides obtectus TaxID=200917 RepID=A0A9P0MBN3_ACAOB|nr:unnamed protein product [Acanthoscelides obtectus]CAK1633859.1 hypothetical protein AOBTE_LOCUS8442 [Acanthoscelides obtectus]